MAINDVSLTSGMRSNLLSLQSTVDLLNRTQNRLSTGKKVNSAIDNPVSFFASQALTSRAATIDSLKDAMGQAVQTITAADKGISAITSMIQQAKGLAQSALSAEASSGFDTETVTLNTVVAGNTIAIGGTTLTAGPSGVATSTSLDNQTITFAANADVGDTIEVGGITFTAAEASTTAVSTISIDMNGNALAGKTVTVGGVSYTGVASTSDTVYDSFALNLHNTAVGDQFTIGGVAYTAVASTATTTYNHITIDLTNIAADDQITVGGHTYTASTADSATTFDITAGDKGAAALKALIATDEGVNFATSGVTGNAIDIAAADGHTLVGADVSTTGVGAGIVAADTTVTTDPITATQFRVGATDALTADNLMDSINAHQAGVFTIVNGAGTNGNNLLTFTAGISDLSATSVQITVNVGSATLTDTNHDVDTTVVGANQFVISGDAAMDATNLMNKINALQGSNYTVTRSGGTLTLVADGSTTLDANTVTSNDVNTVISHTDTTSAATLGQFQFGVGADANATAANLSAKLTSFFGAQLGVANASGSNVITVTSGTTDLTLTTVQAGTDADDDMVIASTISTSTTDAYDATHFAVTGNNATDAAAIAEKINGNAAITAAGFSATASNGVLNIANDSANVAAGDVVVVGGTMTEATVQGSNELSSLQGQYNEMLNQIDGLVNDSGYKGKNLLDSDTLTVKFEGTNLDVVGFNANSSGLGLNAATWTTAGVAETAIDASITALDAAMTTLQSQSSKLSGNLSIISVRQDFSTNMINTLTAGSDKLTAADANEEGANMLMLQTRQSLSTTALSLSAQAAQSVLRLFQ